ncbi:galactosylceramide sulfotransferase-like isoform X2 [Artemia franciscana]
MRQNSYNSIMGDISLFDLVVHHTRWDRSFLESNYKSDFSIIILRDPVDTFESIFHYVELPKFYNVSNFQEFLQKLETGNVTDSLSINPHGRAFGRNQHSWSLGLDKQYYENETAVLQLISKMESKFDLVLMTEYFDESVALLRTLLGGPLTHYLFQKENERLNETKYRLSKQERIKLQNWLKADMMVYNHFLKKFSTKLSPKIQSSAQELRKLNKLLENYCQMKKNKIDVHEHLNNFENLKLVHRDNNRSNLYCSHYGTPTKEKIRAAVKNFEEVKRLFSKG